MAYSEWSDTPSHRDAVGTAGCRGAEPADRSGGGRVVCRHPPPDVRAQPAQRRARVAGNAARRNVCASGAHVYRTAPRPGSRVQPRHDSRPPRAHSQRAADGAGHHLCGAVARAVGPVARASRRARPRPRRRGSDRRLAHRHGESLVRPRRDRSRAGRASGPDAAVGVRQASRLRPAPLRRGRWRRICP